MKLNINIVWNSPAFRGRHAAAALGLAVAGWCASADASAGQQATGATAQSPDCAHPAWPNGALAQRKAGTVQMAFLVDSDGKVKRTRLLRSSGHHDLDEAARLAMAQCRYAPGVRNGERVEAWLQISYEWKPD